jgi:hypothetical protein
MDYKIEGRFLRIEELKQGKYRVWWTDSNSQPQGNDLETQNMVALSEAAPNAIKQYQSNPTTNNKPLLTHWTFVALWPKMYVAYCQGENLDKFFEDKGEFEARRYTPNLKYQDFHHKRFLLLWNELKNQVNAYDSLVTEFPDTISKDGFEKYIVRFRKWNRNRNRK